MIARANTIDDLNREKQELKLAYAALLQRAFRRRSERYLDDPSQLKLDFNDSDDASDAADGLAQAVEEQTVEEQTVEEQTVKEHTRRLRKPRNEKLPEHLPRYEVEVEVPDEMKHCPQHGPLDAVESAGGVGVRDSSADRALQAGRAR